MDKERDKLDILRNELVNEITNRDKTVLDTWSDSTSDNHAFRKLIREMKLSPEIEKKGEAMKPFILQQVNKRIDRKKLSGQILRIGSVAASIILLLGITHHFSFQQGFREVNSRQIEMSNPLGMSSTITLPDGSKVILNAGTTLSYPNAFVSKNRIVSLKGEAFFEVAPDTDHPFIVNADDIRIKVVGTQFNVKAYENDERVEVSLSEGKVEVQTAGRNNPILLNPGEQAYYDKQTHTLIARAVNIAHYTSWKEGQYYFKALPMKEVARQLERIFKVRIQISPQLRDIVFTGDFIRGENLEQILRVITVDKRLKYRIEEEAVYIEAR
ncbi:MAG: FecR domain-containing protein [Tannerellaceae bacterium]|jgi:ferric-dicitrate binding protein FerR (iron transport regulator)|nr:FecR domain-containing protein [Tannerellaceae bacterium]